jgi:hypothetical protein
MFVSPLHSLTHSLTHSLSLIVTVLRCECFLWFDQWRLFIFLILGFGEMQILGLPPDVIIHFNKENTFFTLIDLSDSSSGAEFRYWHVTRREKRQRELDLTRYRPVLPTQNLSLCLFFFFQLHCSDDLHFESNQMTEFVLKCGKNMKSWNNNTTLSL